ncbi:MAG TPA: hypothetical protein DC057_03490 [Spirochaetia bacterium]|nr:hypothetical protein [Spirochaetia bacterium]
MYFEKFNITNREKVLMGNNTWEDSENGRLANVRNDQSISEIRQQQKMIDKIIENYLERIKSM